jgi:hypothetical protein
MSKSGRASAEGANMAKVSRLRRCTLKSQGECVRLRTATVLLLLLSSTGCVVVGGYSSGRGWFIWPGSIVILLIGLALILLMFFRRRG